MIDIWSNVLVFSVRPDHGSLDYTRVELIMPTSNEAQWESLFQLEGQHVEISIFPKAGQPLSEPQSPRIATATKLDERDRRLIEFATTSDGHGIYPTLEITGKRFGITREGARRILKAHSIPKRRTRQLRVCARDGCLTEPRTTQHKYCKQHWAEWKTSLWTTVPCTQCGKDIVWRTSDLKRQTSNLERVAANPFRSTLQTTFFCDKKCHGKHLARTVGFGMSGNTAHIAAKQAKLARGQVTRDRVRAFVDSFQEEHHRKPRWSEMKEELSDGDISAFYKMVKNGQFPQEPAATKGTK